ncbi:MAG: GtrA family protein [Patescibacteria group bacterium]
MDVVLQFSKKMASLRLVRSLLVGVVAIVVQTIAFEILGPLLQIFSLSTAVVVAAETGILTNFYLNNRFSFHDRRHNISLVSRLVRFHLVVSGSVFLQWLFVFIAEHQTSNLVLIHAAYAAGIVLGFVWNYTLYLLFVWRKNEQLPPQ